MEDGSSTRSSTPNTADIEDKKPKQEVEQTNDHTMFHDTNKPGNSGAIGPSSNGSLVGGSNRPSLPPPAAGFHAMSGPKQITKPVAGSAALFHQKKKKVCPDHCSRAPYKAELRNHLQALRGVIHQPNKSSIANFGVDHQFTRLTNTTRRDERGYRR